MRVHRLPAYSEDPTVKERRLGERIADLRDQADALCSEIRDLEQQLEFPPEHQCIDCAVGRRETGAMSEPDW